MSVTPAQALAARQVEVSEDQLTLDLPQQDENRRCPVKCPTPELCRQIPATCWKR